MAAPTATIGDPSIVTSLPRPFDSAVGQTLVGSSYSFLKTNKCVRPELVVGADGANVNLYSVSSTG